MTAALSPGVHLHSHVFSVSALCLQLQMLAQAVKHEY